MKVPPKGLAFRAVPKWAFLYCLSCHLWSRRWVRSFLAAWRLQHLPSCRRHGPEPTRKASHVFSMRVRESINWNLSLILLDTTTDASLRHLIPMSLFCLWICLRIPQGDGVPAAVTDLQPASLRQTVSPWIYFFFNFCIYPSEPPKWKGRKISTVGEVVEQPTGTLTHFRWECKRMQPLWQTA